MTDSVCIICLDSSPVFVNLTMPLDSNDFVSGENEVITYLDCLQYCSKSEFIFDNNEIPYLCCVCAVNLEKTWIFLQKIEKAYERMYIKLEEYEINVLTEEEVLRNRNLLTKNYLVADDESESTDVNTFPTEKVFLDNCTDLIDEFCDNANHISSTNKKVDSENILSMDETIKEKDFICEVCNKTFVQVRNLKEHFLKVHKLKLSMNYCKHCGKLIAKEVMREHMKEAHSVITIDEEFFGNSPENSEIVSDVLAENGTLQENEINKSAIMCQICKTSFPRKKDLREHFHNMHNFKVPMTFCKHCCEYIEKTKLYDHMKKAHSNIVSCDQCDYQSPELTMARHKRNTHSDCKFQCSYCQAKYATQAELKQHLKYHKGREVVSCSTCKKEFRSQHTLDVHMKTHDKMRKTFDCPHCDKTYKSKGSLHCHMRIHEEGKALQCQVCQKSIISFTEMKLHMSFHTRDFQEMCEICGKKFAVKTMLREHVWKHQGLKLKCDKCDKLFPTARSLREHYFEHTGKPFTCKHCGKNFTRTTKFKAHLKALHGVVNMTKAELRRCTNKIEAMPRLRVEDYLVSVPSAEETISEENIAIDEDDNTIMSTIIVTDLIDDA